MAAGHRVLRAARGVLDGGWHGATLDQDGPRARHPTMRDATLLQLALGLTPPWTVTGSDFDAEARRLDIQIDFAASSRFICPTCGAALRWSHKCESTFPSVRMVIRYPEHWRWGAIRMVQEDLGGFGDERLRRVGARLLEAMSEQPTTCVHALAND